MKVKLEVELECNGSMQYQLMTDLLKSFSDSLDNTITNSPYSSESNILVNKITDSGFAEEMLEKDAAIFLNMSYRTLRSLRQRELTPNFFKKGKSFYYHKKDLDKFRGMCQFKLQNMWEKEGIKEIN